MIRKEDVYKVGHISKVHGLKGEVVVIGQLDDFGLDDMEYLIVETEGILVPFFIETTRPRGAESVLVKFCDIDNVDQAQRLLGGDVYVERTKMAEEEEISLNYFVGFTITDDGKEVGTITDIDDRTENWLFVTDTDKLIPAQEEIILGIDHEKRVLAMSLPLGLLDL